MDGWTDRVTHSLGERGEERRPGETFPGNTSEKSKGSLAMLLPSHDFSDGARCARSIPSTNREPRTTYHEPSPPKQQQQQQPSQCATYDEVKQYFRHTLHWDDTLPTHLVVSGVAGLVTTTAIAPVDVVKTRMFMAAGSMTMMGTLRALYTEQGVRGLFKGWSANWARQGPMTTVVFVVSEAVRPWFGLGKL
jgi:hypothetical protein